MPAASHPPRPTRGGGRLEGFLAGLRMNRVLKALKPSLRGSEVLDVGCGSYPLFLMRAPFARKVGIDQLEPAWDPSHGPIPAGLELLRLPLDGSRGPVRLPFPDASFSCVTSLAVLEHLEPAGLPSLVAEIHRVLKPSGQFLMTTPHAFADGILRLLARLGLVSKEEIDEHKSLFFHRHIAGLLRAGGFPPGKIRVHGFLLGLNIFAVAEK